MTNEEIKAAIKRLEEMEPSDYVGTSMAEVVNVMWEFMGGMVFGVELRDMLIDLLRQYDSNTSMALPVDADGIPIRVGEEVCGYDHPNGGVYCHAIVNPCVIAVGDMCDYSNSKGWALWNTLDVRHYHKPTVESVLRMFLAESEEAARKGYDDVPEEVFAEYATKLRSVIADEN